jgi:hypothetical protein
MSFPKERATLTTKKAVIIANHRKHKKKKPLSPQKKIAAVTIFPTTHKIEKESRGLIKRKGKATVIVKGRIAVKQKKKRETVITGKP